MKKLFYISLLLSGFCAFAHSETDDKVLIGQEIIQDKEYKKITVEEVNKEALVNIKAKYGDYEIVEAAVASDGEYKLMLKKDNASITALFTSSGELIKIL